MLAVEQVRIESCEPLKSELESFVECVRTGAAPEVGAENALKAIVAATQIAGQIRRQRWNTPA